MQHVVTCIICPKGCRISVAKSEINGANCERGIRYAKEELNNPVRVLTSTVILKGGGKLVRLPIKTDRPIPKNKLLNAAKLLNGLVVEAPIKNGETILSNILDLGVNIVASRSID